jgi:aspartokinase-like uncharacterized kinase
MLSTPSPRTEPSTETFAQHLVAKVGGSLWASPLLPRWLSALRRFPLPLTIVPGGGPFADAVRQAQGKMGFSNHTAHAMALLAMEQYALALAELHAGLAVVSTTAEARAAHEAGHMAIWRPYTMVHAASDVPASWDVTSDSLAAWYAGKAGASSLLLIKSVDVAPDDDLALRGVVDPCFLDYAKQIRVFVAGPSSLPCAAEIFARGSVAGAEIDANFSRQKIAS